jgi:hypothetical protein
LGLLDKIKSFFVPSEEEVKGTKNKLNAFMKHALKKEDLTGFEIVYGKLSETKDTLVTKKTQYHNYAIAFNADTGELVILPVDPKLASCGWPVFVNNETLKTAKNTMMGTIYQFDMKDGENIMFETPAQNYKIGKSLGAMELPIMQEREAKLFKVFFKTKFS